MNQAASSEPDPAIPGATELPVEPAEPAARPAAPGGPSKSPVLDALLGAGVGTDRASRTAGLASFLVTEPTHSPMELRRALELYLSSEGLRRLVTAAEDARSAILARLARDLAEIDELVAEQVDRVLHHSRFQQLEASWRGLELLTDEARRGETFEGNEGVQVKILDLSWRELSRDAERAVEFDQSQLFRKVYGEFDMQGGQPFGLLIGDYALRHRPDADHPHDDLSTLRCIAGVAAASFSPFVTGLDPAFFGLEDFGELDRLAYSSSGGGGLGELLERPEYRSWQSFRKSDDARFVGVTVPRVLLRRPYGANSFRRDGFRYAEDVSNPEGKDYLWGNTGWAFGSVAIRAFQQSGWFSEIRGVRRGEEGGGLVANLPSVSFGTDRPGIALKASTDFLVTDDLEKELAQLGLIALCDLPDTEHAAFYSNPSLHRAESFDNPTATLNAQISSMLQYVMCVSRFAHYLKIRSQHKVGSFQDADAVQHDLSQWLASYVAEDDDASASTKARYPLRDQLVAVREMPDQPGFYYVTLHLKPHAQLDTVSGTVTLTTEIGKSR